MNCKQDHCLPYLRASHPALQGSLSVIFEQQAHSFVWLVAPMKAQERKNPCHPHLHCVYVIQVKGSKGLPDGTKRISQVGV